MELHLLSSAMSSRDSTYLILDYITAKNYSREFQILIGKIKEYYDKDADFALPAAMKTSCSAKVMTPKPNEKMLSYAQSLDKADAPPEDMELGNYFAQKVTLQCR